jgi:hypothetical protein
MALLVLLAVATQTMSARLLPRQLLEADDLGNISTALYMLRSGAVTGFTAVPIRQGDLEVGRGLEVLFVQVFVARLARVAPDVLGSTFGG